ncbi:MAG: restriction endonuclease subunit S [Candidatus Limiplasma sp.]|nr:restriction endonuclease subunit S [Candidatus Limiplasma sp.]
MVTERENAPLKTICTKIQDGTHFSPVVNGGEYLYVTSRNIGYGTFDISDAQRIDAYQHSKIYERCNVKHGDLLLTKDGANTGNATINPLWEEFSLLSSVAVLRFDPNQHDARFYLQQILSYNGQQQIKDAMSGNAITRLTLEKIKNLLFKIVPLPEQTVIAEALSDADSLILSLEKLVAKKKAIKQGAMQELLTGKKRLSGFSKEWAETSLGEICSIINGGTPSTAVCEYWNGDILWCTPTDITSCQSKYISSTANKITQKGLSASSAALLPAGTLLLCSRATIGEVRIARAEITTNQGFKSLITNKSISNEWLYYLICTLKPKMLEKAIGSTFLEISKGDLSSIVVDVPSYDEQTAIASILSDMDAEIEQLEKKLAKYRLIKQGMMQELLTGRIRLVETDKKVETAPKGHNQHYDDAIAISAIVNAFYDYRFILGRVKVQKLLYLLRRKQDADVSAFKKKAAGPYNEKARYKGGESIAIKSGYIVVERNSKGSKFSKGSSIAAALKYVGNMQSEIDWLLDKFRFYNTNKNTKNLEVLATVDMAVCELEENGKAVNIDAVKDVIRSNKEWSPKLQKSYFTDAAINQAILESKEFFS